MIDCSVCGRGAAGLGGIFRECEGQWLCAACWDNVVRDVLSCVARPTDGEGDGPSTEREWARHLLARVARASRSGS